MTITYPAASLRVATSDNVPSDMKRDMCPKNISVFLLSFWTKAVQMNFSGHEHSQ